LHRFIGSIRALGRHIEELGGWGEIEQIHMTQALGGATKVPSFEGAYMATVWVPGMNSPGAKKFTSDYQTLYGKVPTSNHVFFYLALWTAVTAVELAGTDQDRTAIAEACRSGELEWKSPAGPAGIGTDGLSNLHPVMVHVEDGKLVPVQIPD